MAAIVQEGFDLDPFSPSLFVFCNRKRDKLKILQWEHNGFWLHYRRLEEGRFAWPEEDRKSPMPIRYRQLRWLLDGLPINQRSAHPNTIEPKSSTMIVEGIIAILEPENKELLKTGFSFDTAVTVGEQIKILGYPNYSEGKKMYIVTSFVKNNQVYERIFKRFEIPEVIFGGNSGGPIINNRQ